MSKFHYLTNISKLLTENESEKSANDSWKCKFSAKIMLGFVKDIKSGQAKVKLIMKENT